MKYKNSEEEEISLFSTLKFSCQGKDLFIATTRPELLGACVAVFVNPTDKRYSGLIGKKAKVPLFDFEVPIIADESVDMDFGTGVVKVTPAHDPTDFEVAKRHGLRTDYRVIEKNGLMTSDAGIFSGQDSTTEARNNIVELLKSKGNLVKIEPYKHKV